MAILIYMVKLERMPDNIASEQLDKIAMIEHDKFMLEKSEVKDTRYIIDRNTKEKVALIAYTESDNSCVCGKFGFGRLTIDPLEYLNNVQGLDGESEEVSTTREINTVTREVMITTNIKIDAYPYNVTAEAFEAINLTCDVNELVSFGELIESHGYQVTIYY
jgi:hypothetical protein